IYRLFFRTITGIQVIRHVITGSVLLEPVEHMLCCPLHSHMRFHELWFALVQGGVAVEGFLHHAFAFVGRGMFQMFAARSAGEQHEREKKDQWMAHFDRRRIYQKQFLFRTPGMRGYVSLPQCARDRFGHLFSWPSPVSHFSWRIFRSARWMCRCAM